MDRADIEIPPGQPAQVAPAEVPGLAGLLGLAVGVVIISALFLARDVLVPIMLAVLLSFVLAPLVGLLRRLHIPRVLAVIVTVLMALGIFAFLAAVIGSQIASLSANAPRYAATVEAKVASVRQSTVGELPKLIGRIGRQFDRASGNAEPPPVRRGIAVGTVQRPMQVEMRAPAPTPLGLIKSILGPVVGPLETTIIVLIVAIFILLQREDLRDRLIRLFGSKDLHRTTTAMDDAAARLGRYFLTQLCLNAAFGLIIAIGLYFIGVPSPILWGILAGLLRFVPYIGSFLSALPPLVLAAAAGPDWSMAIWTAGLFLASEPVMGYMVEPMVYGHSTGLSPAAVIISAVFWTWLWGPVGLVLSTPLTLCLVVLGRHFDRLEFLDVLLGDRPALSPVESFYQRMLAGDSDEVLDQAETLLADRSLSSYYDEIAVKGLRLAAIDADRGVLTTTRLARVRAATALLLDDLSVHADAKPAPNRRDRGASLAEKAVPINQPPEFSSTPLPEVWQREGAVLCIAARGPLDDAAATMIAQVLEKHGIGSRTVLHEAASRERLPALDAADVLLICICGLEFSGAPPHLRFLLRRVRSRFPGVPILVTLWTDPDSDQASRDAVDADHYAATVRATVIACHDIAEKGDTDVKSMLDAAFG